jgi:hypothetical protein
LWKSRIGPIAEEIALQSPLGVAANRYDALLLALAHDFKESFVKMEIIYFQTNKFPDSEARVH